MTLPRSTCYSLFLLAAMFVSACGQKGPLYIQESTPEAEQSTANNEATENTKTGASKADSSNAEPDAESEALPGTKLKK